MKKSFILFLIMTASTVIWSQTVKNTTSGKSSTKASPAGTVTIQGLFSAPSATSIVIQNNAKNDLTLIAKKEKEKLYTSSHFSFPGTVSTKSKFSITIKKLPTGQTCMIYRGAAGIIDDSLNKIRIGCDFTYDLVSRSTTNTTFSTFYDGGDPSVGGIGNEEGRYVTFVSSAAGFSGSTGKYRQIFWRDRNTGITRLISSATNGEAGNGDCYAPSISGDGKSVAFESHATNLVPEDNNGLRDIFIWNSITNKTERVSTAVNGKDANAVSYEPSVSGDGNLIAFTSTAGNISNTEKGISNNNVFLRDMQSGITTMISIDPVSGKGGGGSRPSVSFDGNRIAFYSHTGTLVSDDKNGIWDIFLWDKNNPQLKRVSLTADGKERNQGYESANRIVAPSISGNGRYIAFSTTADNMGPGQQNIFQDIFIYDINTGKTVIASNGKNNLPGNADSPIAQGEKVGISHDGTWVAFSTNATNLGVPAANVVLHNQITGENRAVSLVNGSSVGRPSISQSAAYIVFGIGAKLDTRFAGSGIFAHYTGISACHSCPE